MTLELKIRSKKSLKETVPNLTKGMGIRPRLSGQDRLVEVLLAIFETKGTGYSL